MIGLLRVKNEARWIERVIASIRPVCERILVLDDHSTDGTPELCEAAGATVLRSPFPDTDEARDEARDKDYLLKQAWATGARLGDWVLMVDGDEALHPDDIPALLEATKGRYPCCSMHVVYLWDREDQVRVDACYRRFRRPSLFQLTRPDLSFKRTDAGGNFHCSNAPAQLLDRIYHLPVRLLHYGYLHREDRVRKYDWYNHNDKKNPVEDGYRHMVIGDLFPPESRFRHAGPLELEPLH